MSKAEGPTVDLVVGEHSRSNRNGVTLFANRLVQRLTDPRFDRVYAVLEHVCGSPVTAEFVSWMVDEGVSPSMALTTGLYRELHPALPDPQELIMIRDRYLEVGNHDTQIIGQLDQLAGVFKKKLGVILETAPWVFNHDEYFDPDGEIRIIRRHQRSKALVEKGYFKEAKEEFVAGVEAIARLSRLREEATARRLSQRYQRPGIALVSYWGEAHSGGLASELSKRDFEVNLIFDQNEGGGHSYDPRMRLTRYRRFFPDRELTEIDWYRAMIGDNLYLFLRTVRHLGLGQKPLTDQAMIKLAISKLSSYQTLEDIQRLEVRIKLRGFVRVLSDLVIP